MKDLFWAVVFIVLGTVFGYSWHYEATKEYISGLEGDNALLMSECQNLGNKLLNSLYYVTELETYISRNETKFNPERAKRIMLHANKVGGRQ